MGYASVLAALAGAACYFVVNTPPWSPSCRRSARRGAGRCSAASRASCWSSSCGICIAVPTALLLDRDPAYLPVAVLPLLIVRYLGSRPVLRAPRPGPAARPVRGDARREPLDGHRGDQGRRPRRRRLAAALARGDADRDAARGGRRDCRPRWRSTTGRCGSASPAGAGPSPSTTRTAPCSRRWPRSAPSRWPTPTSTARCSASGSTCPPSPAASARASAPSARAARSRS